jgi:alpha-L-fucosidase
LSVINNFGEYIDFMKGQLTELLTNYGPVCELFFDGDWMPQWSAKLGVEIEAHCRALQPDVVINNRVGRRPLLVELPFLQTLTMDSACGDYETPEQFFLDKIPPRDWESNITINGTFGWKPHDNNWKSSRRLIRGLIEISSRGGNFLLNVGPNGEGLIPAPSVDRLAEIGEWMTENGESIYGTTAGPLQNLRWGRSTQKNGKIYLHIFKWPDGELVVDGLKANVKKAYVLGEKPRKSLRLNNVYGSLHIELPSQQPDPYANVIVLEV